MTRIALPVIIFVYLKFWWSVTVSVWLRREAWNPR